LACLEKAPNILAEVARRLVAGRNLVGAVAAAVAGCNFVGIEVGEEVVPTDRKRWESLPPLESEQ
jgi:hypothetical protein